VTELAIEAISRATDVLNAAGYMYNKRLKLFQNNFISHVTTA